jgi:hypothetical protein
MIPNNNPVYKRLEMSFVVFGLSAALSLFSYSVLMDELVMWRGIAVSFGLALSLFIFYPTARGIRPGDIVMVPIWKEIETPFMEESYVESVPTIAMENGRKNHVIEVRLGDGTRGTVKLLHYGIISFPEGRLIELEKPLSDISSE